MTAIVAAPARAAPSPPATVRTWAASALAPAVLAAGASFAMAHDLLATVWRTGAFSDTDDTMHVVQMRALLAGQGWFDMTVPGLNPPGGTVMHWSRMVDLPLAALMRAFGAIADAQTAERLMRLAFPFLLLVGLYLAVARLADALLGRHARPAAMLIVLLSGAATAEFVPGRVDHHAPQILILVLMLGSAVRALDPRRAWEAAVAGALCALSLSINLENLPFIAVAGCWLVALWIARGDPMRRALAAFAAGLGAGLPAFFAATVAPARYAAPVCDAFGAAHLGAGLVAAAGCAAAVLAGARLGTPLARAAAGAATGIAALAFVALCYPSCLGNPFAGVDPLVRELWLARVQESLPFTTVLAGEPASALCSMVPPALGFCALLAAAWRLPPERRAGAALAAAVVGAGLLLAFWQVRVLVTVAAVACCGGVHVALAAKAHCLERGRTTLASLSLALLMPFTATAVGLAVPVEAAPAPAAGGGATTAACLAPAAFRPLAGLEGSVIAPVDVGSFLLVHTRLSVFAAAFHRDEGNRFAFDVMLAPPGRAGRLAAGRGASFVLTCDGLSDTRFLAARAPDSLAAALVAGRLPSWLEPVPLAGTPLRLYRVRPERG